MDNNQDPQQPAQPGTTPPPAAMPGQELPTQPAAMPGQELPTQPAAVPEPAVIPTPEAPAVPEVPPTTDIPQPEVAPPEGEMKSLEEISGIKAQIEYTASPLKTPTQAPDAEAPEGKSKADTYSKLTRIVLPVVVSLAIIAVGYVAYSLFLRGAPDTTVETESDTPPALNLAPPEEDILEEDIPVNLDEDKLEDAIKEGLEPEEPEALEEPTTPSTPKAPSIKPKQ
ncbi:hypothetical protein HOG17_01495 [Candidatus Peregrinibacteria bacterium]|jgi:hypothetical protein|nr:hypothetical protein [Candidatus Peregrinibacteria bacterium]MBT4148407.1 hypothetical protein [Candidatus Peregrinibacteria bacterium]MBT4366466.1 hypothetical protein [Candidatus Peregrinibacteria bacterium]MBT4456083.1 hypothetical protein [Candidatus Peregrinibacteria bacterium]